MKKILTALFALVLLTGCNSGQSEINNATTEIPTVSSFERAQELKNDYYYKYTEIIKTLSDEFPNQDILLSKNEKQQLFPEQMIDENFPCHGQQVASFYKKELLGDSLEIEGNLDKSGDKLSVKINGDDTINFITATAVENGETEGEKWEIITNNELTLIAQDIWQDDVVSTLTISKETGMGIWQKSTASGLPMTYKAPTGLMVYLQCYLPETNF